MEPMPTLLTGRSRGSKTLRRAKSMAEKGGFCLAGPDDAGAIPFHRPQAGHVLPPLKLSGGLQRDLKISTSVSPCGEDAAVRTRSEAEKSSSPTSPGADAPPKSNRSSRAHRTPKAVQIADEPPQRGSASLLARRHDSRRSVAWGSQAGAGKPPQESPSQQSAASRCPSAAGPARWPTLRSPSRSGSSGQGSPVTPASPERPPSSDVAGGEPREALSGRQEALRLAAHSSGAISPGWVWGSQVGRGSFGSVHRAFDPANGRFFAVKQATVDADEKVNRAMEEELRICQELQHPHIVGYLGHQRVGDTIQIFLELCAGGSVAALLAEFGPLEHETTLGRATTGMLKGLAYLHEHKPCVLHRDIKGANLLVDTRINVKLADFGCSKLAHESRSFTTVGSVPWMAPEVIKQDGSGYGRKADIWSAGCTVIEMATAQKPWGNSAFDNPIAAMMRIGLTDATPPIVETAPAAVRDFISDCVRRDPDRRPQAVELLEYDFLRR